jgi:hypothetical protein
VASGEIVAVAVGVGVAVEAVSIQNGAYTRVARSGTGGSVGGGDGGGGIVAVPGTCVGVGVFSGL